MEKLLNLEQLTPDPQISVVGLAKLANFLPSKLLPRSDRDLPKLAIDRVADPDSAKIPIEWNATECEYPADKCIHHLFEERASLHPDAIAMRLEDRSLTYRQLNERANRLANYLQALGVRADVMVGISVERSIEMLVGILGILKAGGAYVPLDPEYPPERLELMVTDTEIGILLTQSNLTAQLPSTDAKIIYLDRDLPDAETLSTANLTTAVTPACLAYVIYTSGSTGTPKGVTIEHRSLVNYATATAHEYGVTPADRILQFTSINFDISVEEIFTCLVAGATLVLRTPDTLDLDTFCRHCREWQISVVSLPTAYWHELTLYWEKDPHQLPAQLRLVVIGGERVAIARFHAWQQTIGTKVRLINTYGPTETTVSALWSDLTDLPLGAEIPIGKPLPNVRAYILNADRQSVPIGTPGELYIGGVGIARGYHRRPERNAARFIDHSLPTGTERLYATGDLVCYRPDGTIDFLGRIDRQVKIRGFRIELAEIEAALDRHPDIAQTVVTVWEEPPGNKQLVAYCVPGDGKQPTSRNLRDFIAHTLPNYLVPTRFVLLSELPLSPNGKVDLHALPAPTDASTDGAADFIAPQDEIQRQLATIWAQVLGMQTIGIRDNFFELGGHSLLAVHLFSEIEKTWGIKLPLSTLFSANTIEQLAQILGRDRTLTDWPSLVLIRSGETDRPPLFCIHPVGGNILEYYPLADRLSERHPIYGLQSQGLDGRVPPLASIEAMASRYIAEMSAVQPAGAPYLLLGYSFGGTIAFEIAHQLIARGDRVQFLGLIDCSSPNLPMQRPSWHRVIKIHLRNIWKLKSAERWKYIKDRIEYQFNKIEYRDLVLKGLSELTLLTPELINIIDNNLQAELNYRAQSYPGDIDLFRGEVQIVEQSLSPDLGWEEVVRGNLQIHDIAGSHYGILREPNISGNAAKIDRVLTDALIE